MDYDDIKNMMENDGVLKYILIPENGHFSGEAGNYAVCGQVENELPKTLYIPAMFNGAPVKYLSLIENYTEWGGTTWAPNYGVVDNYICHVI